jgi:hypothetical protein
MIAALFGIINLVSIIIVAGVLSYSFYSIKNVQTNVNNLSTTTSSALSGINKDLNTTKATYSTEIKKVVDSQENVVKTVDDTKNNFNTRIQDQSKLQQQLQTDVNKMKKEVVVPGLISGSSIKSISNDKAWNWIEVKRGENDKLQFGGDVTNRGIWSHGDRDFGIYTKGLKRFTVTKDGKISSQSGINVTNGDPGPLVEKSYGKDNDRYGVGQFKGGSTRVYAGSAYAPASVNMSIAKPNGQFDDIIKVQSSGHTHIGGAFNAKKPVQISGTSWMPYTDGNTYIRPGVNNGKVIIGDNVTGHTSIGGAFNAKKPVQITGTSWMPYTDGNTYIRSGINNGKVVIGDNVTGHTSIGGAFNAKKPVQITGTSWMPYTDGNTYIRSGINNGKVVIGDNVTGHTVIGGAFNAKKPVQITENTWMPYSDGNTYIRPGIKDGAVKLGDALTTKVDIGNDLATVDIRGINSISSKKRLHLLGDEQLYIMNKGGVTIGKDAGGTGELRVQGNIKGNGQICINNTCLTEADLLKIKSLK